MKKLILILTTILLCSCTISHNQSIVTNIELCETCTGNVDRLYVNNGNATVFVPHGMYNVGDTIKFCK